MPEAEAGSCRIALKRRGSAFARSGLDAMDSEIPGQARNDVGGLGTGHFGCQCFYELQHRHLDGEEVEGAEGVDFEGVDIPEAEGVASVEGLLRDMCFA